MGQLDENALFYMRSRGILSLIHIFGIDTAKAVLNAPREMLIEKTDLEEETVDEVIRLSLIHISTNSSWSAMESSLLPSFLS